MSLIENFFENCVLVEKTRVPDGEGGSTTTWIDGLQVKAAITLNTTMQAQIAEAQGVTSVYTVTVNKNVSLDYHDVIKRVSDGKIFRITTDKGDKVAPAVSSLDIAQYNAEKWELPQ